MQQQEKLLQLLGQRGRYAPKLCLVRQVELNYA